MACNIDWSLLNDSVTEALRDYINAALSLACHQRLADFGNSRGGGAGGALLSPADHGVVDDSVPSMLRSPSSSSASAKEAAPASGGALRKNKVVTGTVTEVNDGGIEVELADGSKAFIRRADLSRDRNDQRPERFGKGDKVDALVTSIDKASRKVGLSIKAREISEEKEAVAQFGSSDSGASLGDILGAALKKKTKKGE